MTQTLLFDGAGEPPVRRSAGLSPCGRFRYWLQRCWNAGDGRTVCFVMLNPSTADATVDDPTIRRCVSFAKAWGFSMLTVRNLYAFRATKPAELWRADDPVGPDNDAHLDDAVWDDLVVAAWGAGARPDRVARVGEILGGKPVSCLGVTKSGQPRHPLYVAAVTTLSPFVFPKEG